MSKAHSAAMSTSNEIIAYINTLPLEHALWWFIENVHDDASWRTEVFFTLRERVRLLPPIQPAEPASAHV